MTWVDTRTEFCNGSSVIATASANWVNIGNTIDLATYQNAAGTALLRDIGTGEPLYLVITARTDIVAADGGNLTFRLVSDAADPPNISTATVHWTGNLITTEQEPANAAATINVSDTGTFTRTTGSFITDGFVAGHRFTGAGFANENNNVLIRTIDSLTATVITVTTTSAYNLTTESGSGDEILTGQVPAPTAAGATIAKVALPISPTYEEVIGLQFRAQTSNITAGTIDAFLTQHPEAWTAPLSVAD